MKERIDFYKEECVTTNITAPRFGLVDPGEKQKARVEYKNESQWVAVVDNKSGASLNFTAIDNCIDILRVNGEMENRFDGMLTGADHIIFIELKNQRTDWIDHAVNNQLQTTIDIFKENYDISQYKYRRAYACNRAHSQFKYSHKSLMQDFRNRNGVRLYIQNEITIH